MEEDATIISSSYFFLYKFCTLAEYIAAPGKLFDSVFKRDLLATKLSTRFNCPCPFINTDLSVMILVTVDNGLSPETLLFKVNLSPTLK